MTAIPDSARAVLKSSAPAHLATVNPDGSPQLSCVWVGLDSDEVVLGSIGPRQKLRNMARQPRVALSVQTANRNELGLVEYLVVHGHASLQEGGAPELLQNLADVYLGPGHKYPPMDDPPPGVVVRITVDRLGGVGPWVQWPR